MEVDKLRPDIVSVAIMLGMECFELLSLCNTGVLENGNSSSRIPRVYSLGVGMVKYLLLPPIVPVARHGMFGIAVAR